MGKIVRKRETCGGVHRRFKFLEESWLGDTSLHYLLNMRERGGRTEGQDGLDWRTTGVMEIVGKRIGNGSGGEGVRGRGTSTTTTFKKAGSTCEVEH
jgi:hypothetical protein